MRAAVRRVNGGAALFLLRLPPIPASRRGSSSYAALQSAYGGHKRANRPGSQDPRSGTNRKEGAPGTREGHQRRRGRESAESGAQPAPRREPRPARVVLPTVPLGSRQAHTTKVESANRLLPPGSAPSTGRCPQIPPRTMICTGFPQACGRGEGAEAAENLCFRQKLYEPLGENPSKSTQNALSIPTALSRQLLERRPFR
jgi:hypothetical protein